MLKTRKAYPIKSIANKGEQLSEKAHLHWANGEERTRGAEFHLRNPTLCGAHRKNRVDQSQTSGHIAK